MGYEKATCVICNQSIMANNSVLADHYEPGTFFACTGSGKRVLPDAARGGIYDKQATHTVTEQAIAQVEANASEQWIDVALEALRYVALRHERLTADDVWQRLDELPDVPAQHEPSALGVVLRQAVSKKIIERSVGEVMRSLRPSTHGRELRVWRSLLYADSDDKEIIDQVCPRCRVLQENVTESQATGIQRFGCQACQLQTANQSAEKRKAA